MQSSGTDPVRTFAKFSFAKGTRSQGGRVPGFAHARNTGRRWGGIAKLGSVPVTMASDEFHGASARTGKAQRGKVQMQEDPEAIDLAADWADISQGLRKDLGQQLHSQWIKPIQLGTFCKETGTLDLFLPTEFSANWVADQFADRLSLAWKIARPDVRHVRVSVHPGRRQMPELRLGGSRGAANDTSGAARDGSMLVCGGDELGYARSGLDRT